MIITATIWNLVIKHVNSFRFAITRIGAWLFKIKPVTWRFSIEREDDWHFAIETSTYWILKEGYWDDAGIWVDSETWKDS